MTQSTTSHHPPANPLAWVGRDLEPDAGTITLTSGERTEILDLADILEANPLPTVVRRSDISSSIIAQNTYRRYDTKVVETVDILPIRLRSHMPQTERYAHLGQSAFHRHQNAFSEMQQIALHCKSGSNSKHNDDRHFRGEQLSAFIQDRSDSE